MLGAGAAPVPPLPCSWLGQWGGPWLPGLALTHLVESLTLTHSPRELLALTGVLTGFQCLDTCTLIHHHFRFTIK